MALDKSLDFWASLSLFENKVNCRSSACLTKWVKKDWLGSMIHSFIPQPCTEHLLGGGSAGREIHKQMYGTGLPRGGKKHLQEKYKYNFLVLVMLVLTTQFNIVTPESNCLGLNPNSHHLGVWLHYSYLTLLCLSVPICTMGMILDPGALGCPGAKIRANTCKLIWITTNMWLPISHVYYWHCYYFTMPREIVANGCAKCAGSWSWTLQSLVIIPPFLSPLLPREPLEDASCIQEARQEKYVKDSLFSLFLHPHPPPFYEVGLALLSHWTKALPCRKDLSAFVCHLPLRV